MSEEIIVDSQKKANFNLPYDFPVRVYETDLRQKPMGFNHWHWHEEFQLCVVTEGSVCMTVQEEVYSLTEGQGIFINAGLLHMSKPGNSEAACYLCINIHPTMLSFFRGSVMERMYFLPYLKSERLSAVRFRREIPWENEVIKGVYRIAKAMGDQGAGYELEVYGEIFQVWKHIVLHCQSPVDAAGGSVFRHGEIKMMLEYIQENYKNNITLDDIAGYVHLSKSGCCRMFKSALDCTLVTYLNEYRIQRSIPLLLNTDMPVTRIGYEVGFPGTSYFIKTFKDKMNVTPGQYRKLH